MYCSVWNCPLFSSPVYFRCSDIELRSMTFSVGLNEMPVGKSVVWSILSCDRAGDGLLARLSCISPLMVSLNVCPEHINVFLFYLSDKCCLGFNPLTQVRKLWNIKLTSKKYAVLCLLLWSTKVFRKKMSRTTYCAQLQPITAVIRRDTPRSGKKTVTRLWLHCCVFICNMPSGSSVVCRSEAGKQRIWYSFWRQLFTQPCCCRSNSSSY